MSVNVNKDSNWALFLRVNIFSVASMDTLVFDIETKNFFTDPNVGWNNYGALEISAVGIYSYLDDKYLCFEEGELDEASKFFRRAERLVGFSMNRYDIPVLHAYFMRSQISRDIDLWEKERVDLLQEIEMATGGRVSLNKLAEANLGEMKTGTGAQAIELYREGRIEDLKKYCLQDVKLTKDIYDLYSNQGFLMVPDKKTGEVRKVELKAKENQAKMF